MDEWAVTFGTATRGLGGLGPRPVPSSLYQNVTVHPSTAMCTNHHCTAIYGPLLCGFNLAIKGLITIGATVFYRDDAMMSRAGRRTETEMQSTVSVLLSRMQFRRQHTHVIRFRMTPRRTVHPATKRIWQRAVSQPRDRQQLTL